MSRRHPAAQRRSRPRPRRRRDRRFGHEPRAIDRGGDRPPTQARTFNASGVHENIYETMVAPLHGAGVAVDVFLALDRESRKGFDYKARPLAPAVRRLLQPASVVWHTIDQASPPADLCASDCGAQGRRVEGSVYGRLAATPRPRAGYSAERSRRRRGCHVDIPWRRVAETSRLGRAYSAGKSRGAAPTWIFRGAAVPRPRRG